jgi:hypothetical protein
VALIGLAFAKVLYATEDLCDRVWGNRPEWARPAVCGIALGLLLRALPQMYGVGYPVLYQAVGGSYALRRLRGVQVRGLPVHRNPSLRDAPACGTGADALR